MKPPLSHRQVTVHFISHTFFGRVTPHLSPWQGSLRPTPKPSPNMSRFSADSGDFLAGVYTPESLH